MTSPVEVVDAEVVPVMDEADARRLDSRIRLMSGTVAENLTKLSDLITKAKSGQIHRTLGFASWTAYLADALGSLQLTLTTEVRRELVDRLTDEGMSQRAIAQAVGVNQATVSRDQQVMHDASPVEPLPNRSPKLAERAAWQARIMAERVHVDDDGSADIIAAMTDDELADITAMADTSDADFEVALSAARAEGDLSRENVAKKSRERVVIPITGRDGKTYRKPKPKPPTEDAMRVAGRAAELSAWGRASDGLLAALSYAAASTPPEDTDRYTSVEKFIESYEALGNHIEKWRNGLAT